MENYDVNDQQNLGGQSIITNSSNHMGTQEKLPNSDAILILGIVSIATCWCYGVFGLVTGIVSLVMASKAKKLYAENPMAFSKSSFSNVKTGQVCGIIGTILSGLYMLFIIGYFAFVGSLLLLGNSMNFN